MIRPRLALRITEDDLSDGQVIRYVGVRPPGVIRRLWAQLQRAGG